MLCTCGSTPTAADPTGISATKSAPKTTFKGLQAPPVMAVPPTNAAAMEGTKRSDPNPMDEAAPAMEITHNPARPAKKPDRPKASTFSARTGWPDSAAARAQFEAMAPIGRMAQVEEVAALVAFLASDEASYITGITMPVGGGDLG